MRFQKSTIRIVLLTLLLLAAIFPVFAARADAQTSQNYWVTVKPTTDSQMYTTVGRNWTLSFEALWSYGSNSGQLISNATVTMKVVGTREGAITNLRLNTTTGAFSFNYSSTTADSITFTPTKVVTQDGAQYGSSFIKSNGNQAYGLQSKSVTVWWDTFQVSLLSYNTETTKTVSVSFNVTYLLLPQEGLTLPMQDTYSNQTFLPKIATSVNVTINGVEAQETSVPGTYSATVSTVFPTAYVLVVVSQKGWTTTYTGFSFAQKANGVIWTYATFIGLILIAAVLAYIVWFKKPSQPASSGKAKLPLIGGVLLLAASFVSLYWGALAVEATSHGFNWLILVLAGLGSFAVGMVGGVFSLKKRNEAPVLLAVCVPLTVNIVVVKYALDAYMLAVPWLLILAATAISIVSGLLISNSDEQFSK